jgi:hypothetical protein
MLGILPERNDMALWLSLQKNYIGTLLIDKKLSLLFPV